MSVPIQKNLEKLSKEHGGITKNDPLKSLRHLVERINKNLDACSGIAVDGITLDKEQLENIKVKMPHVFSRETYTATASRKIHGADKLVLEVRFLR